MGWSWPVRISPAWCLPSGACSTDASPSAARMVTGCPRPGASRCSAWEAAGSACLELIAPLLPGVTARHT